MVPIYKVEVKATGIDMKWEGETVKKIALKLEYE